MADLFADTTAGALAQLGVSATYTPSGGSGIDTTVIVDEELGEFAEFDHLQASDKVVTVLRADAAGVNGVGIPQRGDTVEITDTDSPYNGTTFTVHEVIERGNYTSRVAVTS